MDRKVFCQCDLCIENYEPDPAYPGEQRRGRTITRRTYSTHQTSQALRVAQRKHEEFRRDQEKLQEKVVQTVIGRPETADDADDSPHSLATRSSDVYIYDDPPPKPQRRRSSQPVRTSEVCYMSEH
jgi:hypothetical protein